MQLTISRHGEGIKIAVSAARDARLLGEFVVQPTHSETSAARLVDDLVAFFGSRLDLLEDITGWQGGYSRHVEAGHRPRSAPADPGPPPHQGSGGHKFSVSPDGRVVTTDRPISPEETRAMAAGYEAGIKHACSPTATDAGLARIIALLERIEAGLRKST